MECLNEGTRQYCLEYNMISPPQVGSTDGGAWYGRAGCGALVCESGTYEEANAAIVAHQDEVRAKYGTPPPESGGDA